MSKINAVQKEDKVVYSTSWKNNPFELLGDNYYEVEEFLHESNGNWYMSTLMEKAGLNGFWSKVEAIELMKELKLAFPEVRRRIRNEERELNKLAPFIIRGTEWHPDDATYEEIDWAARYTWPVQKLRMFLDLGADPAIIDDFGRVESGTNFCGDTRNMGSPYYWDSEEDIKTIIAIYDGYGYSAMSQDEKWWEKAIHLFKYWGNFLFSIPAKCLHVIFKHWGYSDANLLKRLISINKKQWLGMALNGFVNPVVMQVQDQIIGAGNKEKVPTWMWDKDLISNKRIDANISKDAVFISDNKCSEIEDKFLVATVGLVEAIRKSNNLNDIPKKVCGELYASFNDDRYNSLDLVSYFRRTRSWWNDVYIPSTWTSYSLVEWLDLKLKTSKAALEKERIAYGPVGQCRKFTYMQILDELRPEDLTNGIKTKPDKVFENAASRRAEEAKREMNNNYLFPRCPWKDNDNVKQITSSRILQDEGEIMHNCVAGYSSVCRQGRTYIFHVTLDVQNQATMEIGPDGTVYQLYEAGNHYANDKIFAAVKEWALYNKAKLNWSKCNQGALRPEHAR